MNYSMALRASEAIAGARSSTVADGRSPGANRASAISTKIGGFGPRVRNGTKPDSNARHQVARPACARQIPLDPPWEA
jgi:hypothetical protein